MAIPESSWDWHHLAERGRGEDWAEGRAGLQCRANITGCCGAGITFRVVQTQDEQVGLPYLTSVIGGEWPWMEA